MDCGAGGSKYCVNDWTGAANWDNPAVAFVWWDEYDFHCLFAWLGFTTFVLYWKRGKE